MPRYNLNQDDIDIIVDALNKKANVTWNPKEQERINRLSARLKSKLDSNLDTQPIQSQNQESSHGHASIHDDPIWNFYNGKSS